MNALRADIVISTNPIDAHWGAMYAAKKQGVPWIADFRDPLCAPGAKQTLYNRFMEHWQDQVLRRANAVIAVSKGLKETLCHGREAYLQKARVIYNGYDAEDRPSEAARVDKTIRFAYTGILYSGKRDLTPFFTALGVLCSEEVVRKEDLVFDYAGKDIEVLRTQAEHGGMEGILRDHGFVSRSESLVLQNDADVLVMATYNDEGNPGVMTGKLYEYMMFKKPILALVGGNVRGSELKEVIESCDVGYCHEENFDDPEALKDFLRSVLRSHAQGKQPCFAYKTQRFAYEGLAGEVETLIEELVKR